MRRIAILAGGTAGHVLPALAVAAQYRAQATDVDILFIGGERGYESDIVPAAGYRLVTIAAAPWLRTNASGKARALAAMLAGAMAAQRILRTRQIELVIGFGGYASAGALLAARALRLPIVLNEPNAQPGLTHRWLAPLANRVHLSFEAASPHFRSPQILITGTPVRSALFDIAPGKAAPSHDRPAHVLVTGGSLGDAFLNRQAPAMLARVAQSGVDLEVLHQVGLNEAEPTAAAYREVGVAAKVVGYLEDMPEAYRWADFAVTCAGAITLSELAAVGLPCLIVPLAEASEDHQTANARAFTAVTGCRWTHPKEWNGADLAGHVVKLLTQPEAWVAAASRLRRFARPDAAAAIVADCEALLGNPSS